MRPVALAAALCLALPFAAQATWRASLPGTPLLPEPSCLCAPQPPGDTDDWLQRAKNGDAYAQWVVSARLINTEPTRRQAALDWLKQSAENGYAQAALDWGRVVHYGLFDVPADATVGLRWIKRAAHSGKPEAAWVLAGIYWNGTGGVAVEREQALQWLRRAAEQGWGAARESLGLILRDGDGLPQDAVEALRWLELAAAQGRPGARFMLAALLADGPVDSRDEARALKLYRALASAGYRPAEEAAAVLLAAGRGEATELAPLRRVLEHSAQAGNAGAAFELGRSLVQGRFGAPDQAAGLPWLERAARANHPLAQYFVAETLSPDSQPSKNLPSGNPPAGISRLHWLERAAEVGFTPAEFALGLAYAHGEGVPTDDRAAVGWYQRAADKGDGGAASSLGWRYLQGVTLPQDESAGLVWLRRAAAQADTFSMANLVRVLLARPDAASHDDALVWIRRLADAGDAQYQGMLGALYSGKMPQFKERLRDDAAALRWLKKAAAQGNGAAEVAIATAYLEGRGVPVDVRQAVGWLERSAARGNSEASLDLARLYTLGRGNVARDPDKARTHRERAAASPHPSIQKAAQALANPALRWVDASQQGYDWPRVSRDAKAGDLEAQRLLWGAYVQGNLGLPKSVPNAYHWFQKGAAQGDPEAMNNMGYALYRGYLGRTDFVAARSWFEKAARKGFSLSMVSLARIYERGEGVPANPQKALTWLLQAGRANNPQAVQWLTQLYRHGGLGLKPDPERAAYWAARPIDKRTQVTQ
jgi:TPR repeat protein